MKTTKRLLILFVLVSLTVTTGTFAQEEPERPKYLAVTKMHWNMDQEDFSMKDWKATEKEYLDKVIMKNDHIAGASFFLHQFTEDNSEILYVQVFMDWNDIDLASKKNGELAKEAWPNDEERKAFFKKRNGYYSMEHSDEIYATMDGAIPLAEMPSKDMTLYLRESHFAFPEDGTFEEWKELTDAFRENVLSKNEYIKGYYPSMHYYGSDRTQYNEAFYVDSLADLDKMLDRQDELMKEAWPDDAARKEMGKKAGKYYTGIHSDFIYTYVSGLSK